MKSLRLTRQTRGRPVTSGMHRVPPEADGQRGERGAEPGFGRANPLALLATRVPERSTMRYPLRVVSGASTLATSCAMASWYLRAAECCCPCT